MTQYIHQSITRYIDDLADRLPAPGGGSASALVGATGIACLLMVVNFTIDKKGYESYQQELKSILDKLQGAKNKLLELVDKDVIAYTELSNAYKLPQNTDEEKKIRTEKIQSALLTAMSVPEEILNISIDMIQYANRLLVIGNKNLLSDIACGVSFLQAAIESAEVNVHINLKYISDKNIVKEKKASLRDKTKTAIKEINNVIDKVKVALSAT